MRIERPRLAIAALLAAAAVAALAIRVGAQHRHPAITAPNDAYIWQRRWTPAVTDAIAASAGLVRRWHILAGELDGAGSWQDSAIDPADRTALHAPVIAVFRLDGQLARWDDDAVLRHIDATIARWEQRGLPVGAVEIDHDCPASQLARYAVFLARLRASLAGHRALWITALPSWTAAPSPDARSGPGPGLDAVLAAADHAVLQVHAVRSPAFGLFDAGHARLWMARFAARDPKPWSVALPAYGSRVSLGADGGILAVDSEAPGLTGDAGGDELMADPAEIAGFIRGIDRAPPAGFTGWVWFRLPTGEDRRAWSPQSWRAVLAGGDLRAGLAATAVPTRAGLFDLVLANTGSLDTLLPRTLRIRGTCAAAGGANGYDLGYDAQGLFLARPARVLLAAGSRVAAGWARCDRGRPDIRAEP